MRAHYARIGYSVEAKKIFKFAVDMNGFMGFGLGYSAEREAGLQIVISIA
jgi:hypothetical protein